jgi:hypothetical protein
MKIRQVQRIKDNERLLFRGYKIAYFMVEQTDWDRPHSPVSHVGYLGGDEPRTLGILENSMRYFPSPPPPHVGITPICIAIPFVLYIYIYIF